MQEIEKSKNSNKVAKKGNWKMYEIRISRKQEKVRNHKKWENQKIGHQKKQEIEKIRKNHSRKKEKNMTEVFEGTPMILSKSRKYLLSKIK